MFSAIAKSEFPALLAALLERANPGQHMEASFRTCGLFPIDKQQVIKRLPRKDGNATANRQLLDETFGERLENLRGVDKQISKKRGKKVAPGKSFTAVDEDETSESEEEADNPLTMEESEVEDSEEELARPINKKIRGSVETSSDESEAEPQPGPSGSSNSSKGKAVPNSSNIKAKNISSSSSSAKNVSSSSSQPEEFPVGTFLVAMYEGTWFVGQVEGEDPDEEAEGFTLIRYMERKGDNRFLYSSKDILKTLNTDILLKTEPPIPVSNRGFWGLPQETVKIVEKLVKEWSILILRAFQSLKCKKTFNSFCVLSLG